VVTVMRLLAALVLAAMSLAGCSSIERGSAAEQSAPAVRIDSAARVSRLLLVPPLVSRENCSGPMAEGGTNDPNIDASTIANWLADWKDYAVTIAPRSAESDQLVADLATWHQQLSRSEPLPDELRTRLHAWGDANGGLADSTALLLIRSHQRCMTATDLTLYFMIVGMPRFWTMMFERNTSVALYDANSGSLLWMAFFHTTPTGLPALQPQLMRELENLPSASVARPAPRNGESPR